MHHVLRFTITKLLLTAASVSAGPIAHYTFDEDNAGSTPDSIGSNSATLGGRVQINNAVPDQLGGGALEMLGGGVTQGPGDGAVTSNSFSWADDARTVTFWWRADSPDATTGDGTFVSFGTEPDPGTRFDIKEKGLGSNTLRVEVQGTGTTTSPTNFDDGNWHFVAVTVPSDATFADVAWFSGVRGGTMSGDLNTSSNVQEIATGTGPLAFGDSIVSTVTLPTASNDRVPNGYLDDVQVYDRVLSQAEIAFLYKNPGAIVATEPLIAPVEFVEDDQAGFDLWPGAIAGTNTSVDFTTDPARSTGTTTVSITASTSLGMANNRGSSDGTPFGYSYQGLYEDLLLATTPTGFLTIDVTGLNPGEDYRFTLYSWDPGSSATDDKVWTVTGGTGTPASASVNYSDPLVDNETFALVFDITADGSGAFQLTNTAGLGQSAINGFALGTPPGSSGTSYSDWAAVNAGSQGPELDFNGNGVANGIEFFMGGTLASPATIPSLVDTGSTWSWTVPFDPAASVSSWKMQVSTDLGIWTDYVESDPEISVGSDPDQIILTLPPAGASGRSFVRLMVEAN